MTPQGVTSLYKLSWCRYQQAWIRFANQFQPLPQIDDKSNLDEACLHLNNITTRWQKVNQDGNLLSTIASLTRSGDYQAIAVP